MASTTITKFAHLQIPLEDVLKATNNFDRNNIIGHGGFGPAYKGQLMWSGTLIKIAALRLDRRQGEGDVEFWTEISVLSDLKHTNLVSLIGFCDEKGEKIIITTYEAKGSLKEHLNSPDLTWTLRLKICVGVARALSYLHYDEGRGYGVIHRNINSSAILLNENWEARLSGFKVSVKQWVKRMDHVVLCEPSGVIGYVDPAIVKSRGVTPKSDLYSFGVVLFEILFGRRAYIKNDADPLLAPLAKHHFENETLKDIIYPDLWNQMMSLRSLYKYSEAAYSCLEDEPTHRPDVNYIVAELEKALELQLQRENIVNNLEHLKIRLSDIKLATNDFSETCKILSHEHYILYIAELNHFDSKNPSSVEGKNKGQYSRRQSTVIINRFLPRDAEGGEHMFYTSIQMLISVKHHNIVTLLGICVEDSEMIFVTENVYSNGLLELSLENVDHRRILSWEKRLKICIDVAYALRYLHHEMEDQKMIINCDISSFNIALDENWGAKIVGFGHSLFLPPNQKDEALYLDYLYGRMSYIDPEYEKTRKLKRESDVYSFGVVLFEVLFGRIGEDLIEDEGRLAHVARQSFITGKLENMVDPFLNYKTGETNFILNRGPNKHSLDAFIGIAIRCVAKTQDQRPTMKVVVEELEKSLLYQFLALTLPRVLMEEDRLQHSDFNQVVDEPERTPELGLTHENIHEKRPQSQNADKAVDKLQNKVLEVQLTHKIEGKNLEYLKICLSDIKLATNNFSETHKVASYSSFTYYKGEIDYFDVDNASSVEGKNKGEPPKRHNTVAIKRFLPGREEIFYTSIGMLTSVKHRNIVTLLGFCVEDSEMILVTENFCNGYLYDYLGNANRKRILTWEKRLKICIDVAHALLYLHSEMEDQKMVINCGTTSYNIGLDENWGAKIVEFGFSVFWPPNHDHKVLNIKRIRGHKGYTDPEYKKSGKLNKKSDVYGFGVILYEILCGRTTNDPVYLKESDQGLATLARKSYRTGTLEEMIDTIIKDETGQNRFILSRGPNKDSLETFVELAYSCTEETHGRRCTMEGVVRLLKKALFFQENNKENPKISLVDVKCATQNFHDDNCIGGGGFGKVYKGNLQDGKRVNTIVAKRLNTRFGQGEQQFLSEIQILLEYKHKNIIGLLGYCDEEDEKIIVYEYASRGSLDKYLNDASLTWLQRLNICVDVARALCFLHNGYGKHAKVIHRDIKAANILINHDWKAKLADFGLSLVSPITQDTDYVIDHACGTQGYLDPLYGKSGFLTLESDIYSFGVVLFEILCGRSHFWIYRHGGEFLPSFIKKIFEEGKHDELVFEQLRGEIEPRSLTIFQKIAYKCLYIEREKRPTAEEVFEELRKALSFQEYHLRRISRGM